MSKCSWRCIAIFFVVLAVILSAALAYITGNTNALLKTTHVLIFDTLQPLVSFLFPTKVPKLVQWWLKTQNKNPPP